MNQLPWICDSCDHFMVGGSERIAAEGPPRDECTVAGATVELEAYQSSEQAADLARRAPSPRGGAVMSNRPADDDAVTRRWGQITVTNCHAPLVGEGRVRRREVRALRRERFTARHNPYRSVVVAVVVL